MTVDSPAVDALPPPERTFLGHPIGLSFLFGTEMWERFSFYGTTTLLILYLVDYLLLPGHAEQVIGYATIKSGLESIFGPLGTQAIASQIYGIYIGLVYLSPSLGGFLADRVLGQRRSVIIGAILLSAGYFLMSVPAFFFIAFPVVILGNGAFKPNISTQVGNLYRPGDSRRDRAFSLFYIGVNVGGFFGPLLCGYLGEEVGWSYGFAASGVGLLAGLLIYLYGLRFVPQDALTKARQTKTEHRPLGRDEWRAVIALIILYVLCIFFWTVWYQQMDTMNLWADQNTDRQLSILGFSFTITATAFQALNSLYIFILMPFVIGLWAWQARRGREPSTLVKMAIGCFLLGLAFIFMLGAVAEAGDGGKASPLWLVVFYGIYTAGELYLSPVGLSLVTKVAPARIVSLMMGLYFLPNFIAGYMSGWLGSLWEVIPKSEFFLLMGAIAIGSGLVILVFNRPLKPMLDEKRVRA